MEFNLLNLLTETLSKIGFPDFQDFMRQFIKVVSVESSYIKIRHMQLCIFLFIFRFEWKMLVCYTSEFYSERKYLMTSDVVCWYICKMIYIYKYKQIKSFDSVNICSRYKFNNINDLWNSQMREKKYVQNW